MTLQQVLEKRSARIDAVMEWTPDGGTTNYRWSKTTIVSGGAVTFLPRIKSWGRLSKRLVKGGPAVSDITIVVDNRDGALDDLVTAFTDTTANMLRADGEILIVDLDDFSTAITTVKLGFASLIRAGGDGMLHMHFTTRADERYFGNIAPPTVSEVMAGLATADAATYGGYRIVPGMEDQIVPIAFGSFGLTAEDALEARPAAALSNGLHAYLFGVSPFGYDLQFDRQKHLWVEGEEGSGFFNSRGQDLYGLNIAVLHNEDPTGVAGKCLVGHWVANGGRIRAPAISFPTSGAGTGLSPGIVGIIEHVIDDFASDPGRWNSGYVDTASFDSAEKTIGRVRARAYVTEKIGALDWIRSVSNGVFDVYFDNLSRLAASNLEQEGAGHTYSSALVIKGELDCVDDAGTFWGLPESGKRGGLANVYSVKTGTPLRGEKDTFGYEDSSSQSRHIRVTSSIEIGSGALIGESSARALALHHLDLTRDPSRIVRTMLSAKGLQLDLDSLVLFSHPNLPGYSTGRYCKVVSLELDLDEITVQVTLIDRHAILTRRVYIVNDESDYLVKDATGIATFTFTASTTVSASAPFFTAGMVGDWLSVGGWPGGKRAGAVNNIWCKIAVFVNSQEITLEAGGGEDGTVPTVIEAGVAGSNVRVYRDRANYASSQDSYTAQLEKYGALCGTDGLFTDDLEQGFAMGEGT